jgi:hypothetical protein
MAHDRLRGIAGLDARDRREPLTWHFVVERVTGIEPALSAWEVSSAIRGLRAETLICGSSDRVATSDRESPLGLTRSGM